MSLTISLLLCSLTAILTICAFQSKTEGQGFELLNGIGVLINKNSGILFLILELNLSLISWVLFAFQVDNPLGLPFQDPFGISLRFFLLWSILIIVVVLVKWRNNRISE